MINHRNRNRSAGDSLQHGTDTAAAFHWSCRLHKRQCGSDCPQSIPIAGIEFDCSANPGFCYHRPSECPIIEAR